MLTHCPNCQAELTGIFCAHCGQQEPKRITWRSFTHRFFERYLDLDHGLLYTFWEMVVRPGYTAKNYLGGIRARYTDPVKYMLIAVSVITLFLVQTGVMNDFMAGYNAGLQGKQSAGAAKFSEQFSAATLEYMQVWMVMFVPFFTFFGWLLFKKSKLNLAEHFIFHCLVYGTQNILGLPFWLLMWLFPSIGNDVLVFSMLATFAYQFYAYANFFHGDLALTIFKSFVTILLGYISFIAILMVLTGVYVLYGLKTGKLNPDEFGVKKKKATLQKKSGLGLQIGQSSTMHWHSVLAS